jgi:protein SFI1
MGCLRSRRRDNHVADSYYDIVLKKGVLRSWKAARDRIRVRAYSADFLPLILRQAMESRAAHHAILQDRLLLRAVYVVWRTRYQGRRLEGITDVRRLKEAWIVWKTRLRQHRDLEGSLPIFFL